jgi:hypothetical protein
MLFENASLFCKLTNPKKKLLSEAFSIACAILCGTRQILTSSFQVTLPFSSKRAAAYL